MSEQRIGLIVVGVTEELYPNALPSYYPKRWWYWSEDVTKPWHRFGEETEVEEPKLFMNVPAAIRRAEKDNGHLALWHHPDFYPGQSHRDKYRKMLRCFPGAKFR